MKSLIQFINEASKGSKKQIKNCKTWKKFFDLGTKPYDEEFNLEYAEDNSEEWIFPIKGNEALTAKELIDLYNSKDKIEVEVTFEIGGGGSDEVRIKSSDGNEYVCDMIDADSYFKGKPSQW